MHYPTNKVLTVTAMRKYVIKYLRIYVRDPNRWDHNRQRNLQMLISNSVFKFKILDSLSLHLNQKAVLTLPFACRLRPVRPTLDRSFASSITSPSSNSSLSTSIISSYSISPSFSSEAISS